MTKLERWPKDAYVLSSWIANTARFRADAGRTIAYLDKTRDNQVTRDMIAVVAEDVKSRLRLSP